MDDFIPSDFLKRTLGLWWLILLIMIAGGALGILASQLQDPIYESQASITTSIDFAYVNRLNEAEEDYLISTVGDIIDSSLVLDSVKLNSADLGISLSDEDIMSRFTKTRQGYRWEMTVRDSDPEVAQTLTQLWADTANQALINFRQKSLDSLKYHTAELALQNCFSQSVVLDPVSANCSIENLAEIRTALSESSAQEELFSNTDSILLSKISTELTDNAYLPGGPVVYKRNLMTLAGSVCGLLIGLGFLIFGKFKTK